MPKAFMLHKFGSSSSVQSHEEDEVSDSCSEVDVVNEDPVEADDDPVQTDERSSSGTPGEDPVSPSFRLSEHSAFSRISDAPTSPKERASNSRDADIRPSPEAGLPNPWSHPGAPASMSVYPHPPGLLDLTPRALTCMVPYADPRFPVTNYYLNIQKHARHVPAPPNSFDSSLDTLRRRLAFDLERRAAEVRRSLDSDLYAQTMQQKHSRNENCHKPSSSAAKVETSCRNTTGSSCPPQQHPAAVYGMTSSVTAGLPPSPQVLPSVPVVGANPLIFPTYGGMLNRRNRDPSRPPPAKKYKCDVCGKAFSRSNTLVTHKRIHTGEKPFKCECCGRAFRQPGNLTRHRLTHTSIKPYVCPHCHKAFNRASNLQTHMRTHTGIRPYHCPHCGQGFNDKLDLKIHLYTHAGTAPVPYAMLTLKPGN